MIGEKIKRLREQLGLSQQQLAGKELTRAFISLVERDRCKPSLESLQLLAHRLGKPVDYFLGDEENSTQMAEALLRTVKQALADNQTEMALFQVREALRVSHRSEKLELATEAHFWHGLCLRRMGSHSEAMEAFETALDGYKIHGSRANLAKTHHAIANCAFALEEFPLAKRHYDKTLRLAEGSKSMQELRIRTQLYLGGVMYRLGDTEAASRTYQEAMAECDKSAYPELWGEIALGLGLSCYREQKFDEAALWYKKAEELFRKIRHPQLHGVIHNFAILEAARSNWEHSYALLQQCVAVYKERGMIHRHASALEEIARYWVRKNNLAKAKSVLQEAIDLLDIQDDGILRGRLYRQLGSVELQDHNLERARTYLLISAELFKRLKATDEAIESIKLLRLVQGMLEAAKQTGTQ
jgi:HTH-type transcriptional regulator, quorum sensing regulator NprR